MLVFITPPVIGNLPADKFGDTCFYDSCQESNHTMRKNASNPRLE
jgi:hypothetical protein